MRSFLSIQVTYFADPQIYSKVPVIVCFLLLSLIPCIHTHQVRFTFRYSFRSEKMSTVPLKSEQISESEPVYQFLHILIFSILIRSERISESESDSVSGNTPSLYMFFLVHHFLWYMWRPVNFFIMLLYCCLCNGFVTLTDPDSRKGCNACQS